MAPNATRNVLRFASVIASVALVVLLVAPGSRADDAVTTDELAALREAGGAIDSTSTTVPAPLTSSTPTVTPPTTVAPATTVPAPTTAPKPAGPTTTRRLTVFDIVGVPIDRGATWIAIATV